MPHMLSRSELERFQRRYERDVRETGSSRFRRSNDVQFAFAYFHWLINSARSVDFDLETFWSETLDSNRDGKLSENEMYTLATIVAGGSPSDSEMEEVKKCLAPEEIKSVQWEDSDGSRQATVSFKPHAVFDRLLECESISKGLFKNAPRFFEPDIVDDPDRFIAFEMISDDFEETKAKLDSIRARRPKFVCVNDDMKAPTEELTKLLRDFYESFFGQRSQFELPVGTRNMKLRLDA